MKKLILAATALSMIATPAMAAPRDHGRDVHATRVIHKAGSHRVVDKRVTVRQTPRRTVTRRVVVNRPTYHRWSQGQRFDRRYASNYSVIRSPRSYHLYDAPRGYQWVRSGDDAVLVALASGLIGAVIGSAF